MEYLRKTKDRLMASVGLAEKIPDDPELVQSQQSLKLLYSTVHSMKNSMTQYAKSMCVVGDAARKMSDDINKFYLKSTNHQESVYAFIDASLDQESNTLLLFKEQFNQDITPHFDTWLYDLKRENDILKALFDQYQYIYTLKQRLEEAQKGGSMYIDSYHSDFTGEHGMNAIKNDMQEVVKFEKSYMLKKQELIKSINNLLMSRYERFDIVFMRLMEFQKDFFADGLEVTEKYSPILQQYRSMNKIASVDISNLPQPKPQQQQSQPKPQQQQPQPQLKPMPQQKLQPKRELEKQPESQPLQKEVNLFDLDFSSPATTPATSPPKATPTVSENIFDIFNTPSSTSTTTTSPNKPPQSANQSFDVLSDIFSTGSPQQQPKPQPKPQQSSSSLEDFFSGPATPSTYKPQPMTKDDGFDSFLSSSSTAKSSGCVDDIDDDISSPRPAVAPKACDDILGGFTSISSTTASSTFDDFDPLGPQKPSSVTKSSASAHFHVSEQPSGPQLTESEEKDAIFGHKKEIEVKIQNWRYKMGVERDIQQLLAQLHTVLWTGHTWKKVDSTQLLDYNSTKKVFRRALLTVHPDKVSTGTPEMKATADLVFEILNNSFKAYEIKQGLRSA